MDSQKSCNLKKYNKEKFILFLMSSLFSFVAFFITILLQGFKISSSLSLFSILLINFTLTMASRSLLLIRSLLKVYSACNQIHNSYKPEKNLQNLGNFIEIFIAIGLVITQIIKFSKVYENSNSTNTSPSSPDATDIADCTLMALKLTIVSPMILIYKVIKYQEYKRSDNPNRQLISKKRTSCVIYGAMIFFNLVSLLGRLVNIFQKSGQLLIDNGPNNNNYAPNNLPLGDIIRIIGLIGIVIFTCIDYCQEQQINLLVKTVEESPSKEVNMRNHPTPIPEKEPALTVEKKSAITPTSTIRRGIMTTK